MAQALCSMVDNQCNQWLSNKNDPRVLRASEKQEIAFLALIPQIRHFSLSSTPSSSFLLQRGSRVPQAHAHAVTASAVRHLGASACARPLHSEPTSAPELKLCDGMACTAAFDGRTCTRRRGPTGRPLAGMRIAGSAVRTRRQTRATGKTCASARGKQQSHWATRRHRGTATRATRLMQAMAMRVVKVVMARPTLCSAAQGLCGDFPPVRCRLRCDLLAGIRGDGRHQE